MGKPEEAPVKEELTKKEYKSVVESLKDGQIARRASWPGGTFIFRQVPATVEADKSR